MRPRARHQRQTRTGICTGRARIGSPRKKRSSSSANASADAYRCSGVLDRHLRAMVSRSRLTCRLRLREVLALFPALAGACPGSCRPGTAGSRSTILEIAPKLYTSTATLRSFRAAACSGAHIRGCADDATRCRQVRAPSTRFATPKSTTCGCPCASRRMFAKLQIAMQHAALVGVMHGAGHRRHQSGGLALDRPAPPWVAANRCQVAAVDQLHREVLLPLMLADFVDGNDQQMVQRGGVLGLLAKTQHVGRRRELAGRDHLQGHHAVERRAIAPRYTTPMPPRAISVTNS